MATKILIIGGTGMLGRPVVNRCLQDGYEVSVMSTRPALAREMLGPSVPVVEGDVTDLESLKRGLEGQDAIYLSLNSKYDPDTYQRVEIDGTANVARTAAELGVARIGLISGASCQGIEKGIIYLDAKVQAERALMECGVPYTIMRPSWFFESLPKFVVEGRAAVLGKQPIPRGWLAATDYARQVSRAFDTDEAANKCFYNLGPQKLTLRHGVETFCKRFHPELAVETVGFAMAKIFAKTPSGKKLRPVIPFFEYFEDNPEDVDPSEAERILGPNLTTIEEWLDGYQPDEH